MTDLSQIEILAKEFKNQVDAIKSDTADLKAVVLELEQKGARRPSGGFFEEKSGSKALKKIIESDQVKSYRDKQASAVTVTSNFEIKALTTEGLGIVGSTGYDTQAQRDPEAIRFIQKPTTLIDALRVIPVSSASYEYVKLKSTYENAADYQTLEGDTKAEQSIPTEAKSVTHRTIAVTTIVSNQVISDNNSLQATIISLLGGGVLQKLEREIVQGDGTGSSIEGFAKHAKSYTGDASSATALIDAIGEARAEAKEAGLQPSVVLVNPVTLQKLTGSKSLSGDYVLSGDGLPGLSDMWTLRIIESAACPRDEAYILDMEQIAVLDREQLTVKIDDMTLMDQNLTRIRVELRASFANFIEGAIVKVTVAAPAEPVEG